VRCIKRACACLLALLAGLPPAAHAVEGTELFALGALQKGLGGAGAAHAYDSSWLLLNPAATAELDGRLDLHFETLRMHAMVEPRGVPIAANNLAGRMTDTKLILVPGWSGALPLWGGVLTAGAFGTQGNRVDFSDPFSTLGYLGNGARRSEYAVIKLPIAYARDLGQGWALGVAAVPTVGRFRTDSLTLRLREAEGDNEWDNEIGYGFIVGLQKRFDRLRLGVAYHTQVWMGDYEEYDQDLLTESFDLPQKVQAGLAYAIRPNLEVLLDYKWVDWDAIPQLGRTTVRGGLGWRDQHIVKAGVNWDINPRWSLRGGISHGKSPITPEFVFANSNTPGLSNTTLAIGATYRLNERHHFHCSLNHVLPEELRNNGKGDFFSIVGTGTRIGYQEDSFTVEYSYHF